ncbi:MAG: DNA cytosine methyltransferase [Methylophilaceae bacterium]
MEFTAAELFAGVGGFRVALERSGWKTIWANQWEPATKVQWAADCYKSHFPDQAENENFNTDISVVTSKLEKDKKVIPDHTLLVGGFPCQDYSVATTQAKGMLGKKGVLWWEIEKIIAKKKPPFVLLENVDRLLVSPAKQRGRDMGILLACLNELKYSVEWRVINAADYGFPQKRRRVFIFAWKNDLKDKPEVLKRLKISQDWLQRDGFFASAFPVKQEPVDHHEPDIFDKPIQKISDEFTFQFHNAGVMSKGQLYTLKVHPNEKTTTPLSSILEEEVADEFYVSESDLERTKGWKYVKGAKKEQRTAKTGHVYHYTEGAIPFPENLDSPSRTILTGEGNQNPNRSTHLIQDPRTNKYRTLTPVEVEKLNGFDEDWTNSGMPKSKRYFCMGNALVVGVVERLGRRLKEVIES